MKLTRDNLHDFIRGAAILGTGGGGDPYVGRLMLEQELRKGTDIQILDPDDLADDIFAINVFSMDGRGKRHAAAHRRRPDRLAGDRCRWDGPRLSRIANGHLQCVRR
ncbi:MAG: DUF917 family protein [Alphaproteobacteria bacterium]